MRSKKEFKKAFCFSHSSKGTLTLSNETFVSKRLKTFSLRKCYDSKRLKTFSSGKCFDSKRFSTFSSRKFAICRQIRQRNGLPDVMYRPFLTQGFIFLIFLISGTLGGNGIERLPRITEHPSNVTVPRNDPVTLKCGAEGYPDPDLIWYKDGIRVQPSTHRVFLPTGSLFFLRVTQSKKESDAGVYWCEAINRVGRVRSKNASLEIAFLRDDFRTSPTGGRVVAGERAELDCVPPRGYPPPDVSWEKNGNSVLMNDRVFAETGKLIIRETLQTDEGRYTCIATNRVGSRNSKSAILAVLVRPFFVRLPGDATGVVGMNARLECRAGGAPRPHVLWRRHDGRMPLGRARMAEDNALIITNLVTEDAGVYICQAENDVATVVANATLTVRDPPSVDVGPKDTSLLTNSTLQLPCKGEGAPSPVPLWTIAGKPKPYSPGWSSPWAKVMDDGTLEIKPQSEEDGGVYTCLLLSESGGAHTTSYITVVNHQTAPPPSFTNRPLNQTLPAKEPGTLHCRAKGPPSPRITWHRGPTPVKIDNNRIKMTKEGDLFFEELLQTDSGTYYCIATSSTGESRAAASLMVLGARSMFQERNIIRQSEPIELPPAPSRPRLIFLNNTTATFSWRPGQLKKRAFNDKTTTLDYAIEVSVEGGPWRIVATLIPTTSYTAKLAMGMAHIFVVRARGSMGESPPSPWSPLIIGGKENSHVELERPMKNVLLNFTSVSPTSSRALKITWQVTEEGRELDGLYVHFRPIWKPIHALHLTHSQPLSLLPHSSSSYSISPPSNVGTSEAETWLEDHTVDYVPWGTVTVLNAGASSYVLTRLSPNTLYQVFLVPFKRAHSGVPSAMLTNATNQEAPAGPPTEVLVRLVNISVARISWQPPETRFVHGTISHYRILIFVNESSIFMNKTVSSSTFSYQVANLIPGHKYSISVSAISKKGPGPPSQPIRLQTDSTLLNPLANRHARAEGVVGEAWFFIVLVGGAMFFLLLVLVILLFIRRYSNRASKLPTLNGSVTKTSNLANFYGGENLWPDAGWHGNDDDLKPETKLFNTTREQRDILASLAPEYAEIDTFGTFSGSKKLGGTSVEDAAAEAYATATLISNCNSRRNKAKIQNDRTRQSQDVLNNTDTEEKHLLESKRPFFIETSTPPIVPPTPLSFSSGAHVFRSSSRGATLGPYATSQAGGTCSQNGVSPYSVNTFTSQPHLLQKGITLTLRNFPPPPPDHPPPTQTFSHLRNNFSRTKTMEELPYACYSSTQISSPMLARATSLEGGSSSYAPASSATYQSIEGLTEGMSEFNEDEHQSGRCNNCGSRASMTTSSMKTKNTRNQHRHHHHHHSRHCNHYQHNRNHMLQSTLEKNHHNTKMSGCYSGASISSSQQSGMQCCKTPILGDFESTSCSYTPNFYGWMSPPTSPRNIFARGSSFECEGVSLDGTSIYGGSARSDMGGEYGYGRSGGGSFYGSSIKSLNIIEDDAGNSENRGAVTACKEATGTGSETAASCCEQVVSGNGEQATVASEEVTALKTEPKSNEGTPSRFQNEKESSVPPGASFINSSDIAKEIDKDLAVSSLSQADVATLLRSCDKQTKLHFLSLTATLNNY